MLESSEKTAITLNSATLDSLAVNKVHEENIIKYMVNIF